MAKENQTGENSQGVEGPKVQEGKKTYKVKYVGNRSVYVNRVVGRFKQGQVKELTEEEFSHIKGDTDMVRSKGFKFKVVK